MDIKQFFRSGSNKDQRKVEELELKVAEAMQNDIGRGIIRIDEYSMKRLGIISGDIVKIIGNKTTASIVWPLHPQDSGFNIIRMEGMIRQNSESQLGNIVRIRMVDASKAEKVVIAPTMHEIKFGGDFANHVKQRLLGRPLVQGDTFSVGILGQAIPFTVLDVYPNGVVWIEVSTALIVKGAPGADHYQWVIDNFGYDFDWISEYKVITVKTLPKLDDWLELSNISEFQKVISKGEALNKYEDDNEIVLFNRRYFYKKDKTG